MAERYKIIPCYILRDESGKWLGRFREKNDAGDYIKLHPHNGASITYGELLELPTGEVFELQSSRLDKPIFWEWDFTKPAYCAKNEI